MKTATSSNADEALREITERIDPLRELQGPACFPLRRDIAIEVDGEFFLGLVIESPERAAQHLCLAGGSIGELGEYQLVVKSNPGT